MNQRLRLLALIGVPLLTLVLYALLSVLFGEQNTLWTAGMFLALLDRALGVLVFLPRWLSWAVVLFFLAAGARFLLWENGKVSEGQRVAVVVTAAAMFLLAAVVPPLFGAGGSPDRGAWWRPDSYRAPGTERVSDGISFVWVPAGRFTMGSPNTESGHNVDEVRREVVFPRGLWVSRNEITVSQYKKVMEKLPEIMASSFENPDFPVIGVSYEEALAFAATLSKKGKANYRLPREDEWEYACRAGSDTPWSFGGDAAQLPEHAWFAVNSDKKPHPVGELKPNGWGIYDMHGNAAEWCSDVEIRGKSTTYRVYRGGNWEADAAQCRSAARGIFPLVQTHPAQSVGIRIVHEP
jgi:formylglycine-generating enzyme required for sulfatase activity